MAKRCHAGKGGCWGKGKNKPSPYQKYGKTAFKYSEQYDHYLSAVKAGRHDEARRLSIAHSKKWLGVDVTSNLEALG